jgi:hypothetical protein
MNNSFEVRRQNLLTLIRDSYQNNRAEFCRATGKNPNLINLVLSQNEEYRRNIGEKLARDIEQRAGIAAGWLDSPRGIGIRRVTKIPILTDAGAVPDAAPLESDYHVTLPVDDPTLALRSTGTRNLAIVIAQESCMAPTFRVGDFVWVDLGVKKIAGDGIYVIRMADGSLFRRIQQLPTGELRVSTDDPAYAPQILKGKAANAMRVIGKAIACNNRTAL